MIEKPRADARMRRKIPADRQCPVCSKSVNGRHYGVPTCGGCYTFFKRATKENVNHKCRNRPNMNRVSRPCRGCRWEKCVELGMIKKRTQRYAAKSAAQVYIKSDVDASCIKQEPAISREVKTEPVDEQMPEEKLSTAKSLCEMKSDLPEANKSEQRRRFLENNLLRILSDPVVYESYCSGKDLSQENRMVDDADQMSWAIASVRQAARIAFGRQNRTSSTEKTYTVLGSLDVSPNSPTTTPVSQYNYDTISSLEDFAFLLREHHQSYPASQHDEFCQQRRFSVAQWKLLVAFLILHTPLETDQSYDMSSWVKVDCDKSSPQPPLSHKDYMDCTEHLRELIGALELDQTGRYLLMAVILCEPDSADLSTPRLAALHGYFLNALLEVVRQRCSHDSELAYITERLDRFFGTLPIVHDLLDAIR